MTVPKRPVLWHQGLFLQPQHFQQLELYFQSLLTPLQQNIQPYFWGVADLRIQRAALENRMLEVLNVEAVFQDGTATVFPGNAVIQARSFEKIELDSEGSKPFRVYLGLKKIRPAGKNATSIRGTEDLYSISTRFVSADEPEEVEDIYLGSAPARARYLQYVLKIFWETEVEQLGDYWLLPVALLDMEGDSVRLAAEFIPPVTNISGSDRLHQVLKNIREYLRSRSNTLEMYKLFREVHLEQMEVVSLRNLMALKVINRYVPVFQHMLETPRLHPWTVYGLLRQFIGELSTFSERIDSLGRLADGRSLLRPYDHHDLGGCFGDAQQLIKELLNAIVVGQENVLHLSRQDNDFKGRLDADVFGSSTRFILSVKCSGKADDVVDSLLHLAKVGSLEEMPTMISRALPGIPLQWQQTSPPGLPQRPDVFYFNLQADHSLWTDIRHSGNFCLHWDEAPEDASVELIISRI